MIPIPSQCSSCICSNRDSVRIHTLQLADICKSLFLKVTPLTFFLYNLFVGGRGNLITCPVGFPASQIWLMAPLWCQSACSSIPSMSCELVVRPRGLLKYYSMSGKHTSSVVVCTSVPRLSFCNVDSH